MHRPRRSALQSLWSNARHEPTEAHQLGARGEDVAARHLQAAGLRVLEQNVRTPFGEIDLIAQEADTLCVVEVKTRRHDDFGGPLEAVTQDKRRRIARAGAWYVQQHRLDSAAIRFDVVAVTWPQAEQEPLIDWIPQAFEIEDV